MGKNDDTSFCFLNHNGVGDLGLLYGVTESFLKAVRFILAEYGPISSHVDPICLDFAPMCLILN